MANQNLRPPLIAVTREEYQNLSKGLTPKPTVVKNSFWAFMVGGGICAVAQVIVNLFVATGLGIQQASTATTALMILLGALLTGIGIYDELGKYAGAGSIVPVTGFANSIVSPALEFKREGYVMGVGARLFTIAGPVLVFGITTSIIVGIIYYLWH